ncbi:MAG: S8 family serine peptidase [Planctomycetes bacterium]|nr:S8 family serine peptidase [Planctomycetota bacterium]
MRSVKKAWVLATVIGFVSFGAFVEAAEPDADGVRHVVRLTPEAASAMSANGIKAESTTDYGSFVWMELSKAQMDQLQKSNLDFQEDPNAFKLTLGEQTFDPLRDAPVLPSGLAVGRSNGPDLHLIQMKGPTKAAWVDELEAAGLRVVQYIHPHTYVVWGDLTARESAATKKNVRWTGEFAPAYRLLPALRGRSAGRESVRVLTVRGADARAIQLQIEAMGGKIDATEQINGIYNVAGVSIPGGSMEQLASIPGVYSVQIVPTDGGLRTEMSDQVNVNNVDGTNLAFPGYQAWLTSVGVDGSGVIIANVDGGIFDTHPDLVNRMLGCVGSTCGGGATDSHGTHTAGIMAADGSSGTLDGFGFLRGLGVAPGANLVEQLYNPTFTQAGGMLKLMTDSYNNNADLSGNSWGPAGSPQGYDNDTLQVDVGVRDADPVAAGNQPLSYVLSFMNGNGGFQTQGSPDEAKNIFTIGSTKMQTGTGAQDLNINDISANSAHGPARDNRLIPHMVAPGCSVDSPDSATGYGLKCGTSMASPHVAGGVALFIEYYRGLAGFVNDPSPALVKAAFLPVAINLAGFNDADGGTLGNRFDAKQGWGRMDLEAVVDPANTVRYFDNPVVFDNTGEEWNIVVSAEDPAKPLKMMLVWTDAPGHGLGGTTPAWNNDLDLIVDSGASTFRGNNFGAGGWSQSGGSADTMNNTEGVLIGPTAAGSYTVRVVASNITSDAIPGVGDATDQDFALVCYNCAEESGFTLSAVPSSMDVCAPADAQYTIDVGSILGFNNPIDLAASGEPAGTTVSFSVDPVIPGNSSVMTVTNMGAAAPGSYAITVSGTDTISAEVKNTGVQLGVTSGVPGSVALTLPGNGAVDTAIAPSLSWNSAVEGVNYEVQVASDAAFTAVVYSNTTTDTSDTVGSPLNTLTTYYWRVRSSNICGTGTYSSTFSFTTSDVPSILLVDDDDNSPNQRPTYEAVLNALGAGFDVWDTVNTDNEPSAAQLAQYELVIWFTADEFGGAAGPGPAGEAALSTWLDNGGCLMISSQDYHFDRGLTPLMTNYLGVSSVSNDTGKSTVTGAGSVFSGLGPYSLSFPFTDYSDTMTPNGSGEIAFSGNNGTAATAVDTGTYQTVFMTFPFEALPASGRQEVMTAVLGMCGTPNPFNGYDACMTGPDNGPVSPACVVFDLDADDDVDLFDFLMYQAQ